MKYIVKFSIIIMLFACSMLQAQEKKVKASQQDIISANDSTEIVSLLDSSGKKVFRRLIMSDISEFTSKMINDTTFFKNKKDAYLILVDSLKGGIFKRYSGSHIIDNAIFFKGKNGKLCD